MHKKSFVIQQHKGRALHYDLRLETNDHYASWAIPKGPSLNPADKRLAIKVEDHTREQALFEGIIPEGEYGAGPVILWDKGSYKNLLAQKNPSQTMQEGIAAGRLEFTLDGYKLHGSWALIHMDGGTPVQWLLIKMDDQYANRAIDITKKEPKSIISHKTIDELKSSLYQR